MITCSLLTCIKSKQVRGDNNYSILIRRRVNVKFIFLSNSLYFLLHILVDDVAFEAIFDIVYHVPNVYHDDVLRDSVYNRGSKMNRF